MMVLSLFRSDLFSFGANGGIDDCKQQCQKDLETLGHQVKSVVSVEYLPHKGNSNVYIELSGN
jgi:hypothetical protein